MNETPLLRQTWPNFKLDFTATHQELCGTDAIVDESGLSSANVIVAQIVDQLRAEVPTEIEQIITTTPPSFSDNLPTVNAVQATSDPLLPL